MFASLPPLLDPIWAVDTEAAYAGSVPLDSFPRLREILVLREGEAHYDLAFRRDDGAYAVAIGSVHAALGLECQRCLEPMRYQLDADIALALVKGLDEAGELPDDYDPLILEERLIRSRDLLEDELLLGIPQIPMHPRDLCVAQGIVAEGCPAEPADVTAETNNPFAVLVDLKQNDKP